MVIAALQYGLGNQLFQYAAARAVADRVGSPLFLDATHYQYINDRELELKKFRVRAWFLPNAVAKLLTRREEGHPVKEWVKATVGRGIHTLHDAEQGYDPRVERLGWFSQLDGLWQSERYFIGSRARLLEDFQPQGPLPEGVADFARQARNEASVALHVRRGDLVTDEWYAESVGALGLSYYEEALSRLKERVPEARVYVFSDDPAWCAAHLPAVLPLEIVSGRRTRSAVEDFAAMKACRHFIIANSTFSWWTAWLGESADKQVFAPMRFFRQPRAWEKDLLPESWEKLEPGWE